jgi:hypothetical protein
VTILLTLGAPAAHAQDKVLSPAEVVNRGREFTGQEIVVRGEAIGEALRADGDHHWVNILGGGVALGLFVPDELAAQAERFGKYGVVGDTITVRGTVNVACAQHHGEFDVHVTELVLREAGGDRVQKPDWWKAALGAVGLALGVFEYRVYRRRREFGRT